MTRFEIPVAGRIMWATGDTLLWVDLNLLLKDSAGKRPRQTFLVDTGTQVTTMPACEAKQLGIPLPQRAAGGVSHRQTGLEIRPGVLSFRIAGMDQTDYSVPCFFLGDPDAPPSPGKPAAFPRRLLQPLGLLGKLRFGLDKDPAVNAPYGVLTIEKTP